MTELGIANTWELLLLQSTETAKGVPGMTFSSACPGTQTLTYGNVDKEKKENLPTRDDEMIGLSQVNETFVILLRLQFDTYLKQKTKNLFGS